MTSVLDRGDMAYAATFDGTAEKQSEASLLGP